MFLFRTVSFMKERKMKNSNIIISSDDQKRYYINYINEINEALKAYEERKKIKEDIKNYSRAYKFFMSKN